MVHMMRWPSRISCSAAPSPAEALFGVKRVISHRRCGRNALGWTVGPIAMSAGGGDEHGTARGRPKKRTLCPVPDTERGDKERGRQPEPRAETGVQGTSSTPTSPRRRERPVSSFNCSDALATGRWWNTSLRLLRRHGRAQ